MINRRKFIKKSICFGIGLMAAPIAACNKNASDEDIPASGHPAIEPAPGMNLYGSILDDGGKPIAGVVVSDGYKCVVTDNKGIYQMQRDPKAVAVYFSTPEQYEIQTTGTVSSAANFFSALDAQSKRYNFNLKKLPAVENDFKLICIADPQVTSSANIERYKAETILDLKKTIDASTLPCYGLVLGDTCGDHPELFQQMRNLTGSLNMPYFTTIGNHDKAGGNADTPRNADAYTSIFGPVNHSWNRGRVHFVALDNIIFSNNTDYVGGLEDYQIEWLRQDLSYVPKDKMIILYYHIPIRDNDNFKNRTALLDLLKNYAGVHFMVGHTHYNENYLITSPISIYEHIHGAACGAWWRSVVNCDGAPNGYAVYSVKGAKLTDWFYKPTNYNDDFQIRIHWGDTEFGGQYGTFSYRRGYNIVANIWNADSSWIVEAWEDGVKAGTLTRLSSTIDAFAAGYHVGVRNLSAANYGATGNGNNKHAYLHTLKNKDARKIEIRATDPFGKTYSQTEIISNLETAEKYY